MIELYSHRLKLDPETPQNWATLAFLYYNQGDINRAIEILREAQTVLPSFTAANCFIDNIEAGLDPQQGC